MSASDDMELYDLRVTVDSISGRPVCGLAVGDYFEVTESSRLRLPPGGHFCIYALAAVLPLLPAKQRQLPPSDGLAALDAASGGRAYLGLARGAWLDAIGIEQRRPLDHLRDTAAIVRALLSGDERGYAGAVYRLAPGARLRYPVPGRVPPLLIGAWGPRGVALAGEIADEVKVGGSANPAVVPVIRAWAGQQIKIVLGAVT